jgi:23S rRNA (cytosine1962-C5)-methyltransferase
VKLRIIHLDDDLVAIDKPIAMPTHAPQPDPAGSDVVSVLSRQLGVDYLGVHQRLDADTSGVMLFARRREANAGLAAAFASRDVRKHYAALVHGAPSPSSGTIDLPIAPADGGLRAVAEPGDPMAQRAVTRYATRWTSPDGLVSLVDLHPETGRTHQLRVHLRAIGTPIVGDPLYDPGRPFPRLMLHACALELTHPTSGEPLRLVAELPQGFDRDSWVTSRGFPDEQLALRLAIDRRAPLLADRATTACRLVNADADAMPGVVVDRIGSVYRIDVGGEDPGDGPRGEALRERISALVAKLTPGLTPELEPGLTRELTPDVTPEPSSELTSELTPRLTDIATHDGSDGDSHAIVIDAIPFVTRTISGRTLPALQYRETTSRVREWCRGRRVLACGVTAAGLSHGAHAGAADLFVVERARPLLQWLGDAVGEDGRVGMVAGELHEQLDRLARNGRQFEVVLIDLRAVLSRAPRGARTLERAIGAALALVERGGLAVLCLDDRRVTRRAYRRAVSEAARSVSVTIEIAGLYGASPIDFPVVAGAESALKVMAVRVD